MCGGAAAEARGRAASTREGVGRRRGSIDERGDSTRRTSGRGDGRLEEARERQRKDWRTVGTSAGGGGRPLEGWRTGMPASIAVISSIR